MISGSSAFSKTSGERHSENGVARLTPSPVNRLVGICTRMRLDISMVGMEKFTSPGDGEALDFVDVVLAAIVAEVAE